MNRSQALISQMQRSNKAFLVVLLSAGILLFSLLYLKAVSPYWNITPDSALYITAGQSIARGGGYYLNGGRLPSVPPMTSLIFSLSILLFPGSYFALHLAVATLTLASLLLAFVLFKYDLNGYQPLVLVLMSLGSTTLFLHSTFLLSDIVYLFFSLLALTVIELPSRQAKSWPLEILIGMLILAACMTRIVGVALVAAVIVSILISWIAQRATPSAVLVAMLLAVMGFVGFWEYHNKLYGVSNFQLFLQNEPWVEEAGYMSPAELITRFFQNLDRSEEIARIFSNGIVEHSKLVAALLAPLGIFFFLTGLLIALKKPRRVAAIYTVIYLWVITVFETDEVRRYLIPILPFLFYYSFLGIEFVKDKIKAFASPAIPRIISAALACYIVAYLCFGLVGIMRSIPAQRESPFGAYSIKYGENYDTQRLAMWLKDHSKTGDSYLAQHADMMNIITQRNGYNFPLSSNPKELLDLLRNKKIRYVLADKKKPEVQKYLLPVIVAHPDKFNLVKDERDASVYLVSLQ